MIGKFTSNCGSGSNSTQNTQVREEDVQLQENYENMGIKDFELEPIFHNQRDINTNLYRDLYYPGLFWVPIEAHSGSVFLHGKLHNNEEFHRNRTFGRSVVACGEVTVFIDPFFEARIYKTTDDKLTISIDIEGKDLDIVKDIDFSCWRPLFVQLEPSEGYAPGEGNRMTELMNEQGYILFSCTNVNLIYIDKGLLERLFIPAHH